MGFITRSVLLFICSVNMGFGYNLTDVERLHTFLFNASHYNKNIRPLDDQNHATQVNMSQSISSIDEIDVLTGHITAPSILYISWFDDRLTWKPADYGGITYIAIPKDMCWIPKFILVSGSGNKIANIGHIYSPVWLKNNGAVDMITGEYFVSTCTTDSKWYPFDSQTCGFYIGSTMYDANELILNPTTNGIYTGFYTINKEWDIVMTKSTGISTYVGGASYLNMSYLTNTLIVSRRPAFIIIHSLVPISLLDMLCFITCFIHPYSGERLSFAITVFLSFVFLGNGIIADLPHNSLDISLSSFIVLGGSIMTSFGVLWSVLIVRMSKFTPETKQVPRVLRRFVIWSRRKNTETMTVSKISIQSENTVETDSGNTDKENNKIHANAKPEVDVTWLEVVILLDKIYAICLIAVTFVVSVVVLIAEAVYNRLH